MIKLLQRPDVLACRPAVSGSAPGISYLKVRVPPNRKLLTKAALIGGNVFLWLVLLEIAFRSAGVSFPQLDMLDRDVGWVLQPGVEGTVADENKQGVYVRINSDGLRDREHSIAKEPGVLRIAVLGDSFAEAIEVPVEKTFWAVLERQLAKCPLPGIQKLEVINFGVGGYGTAQELLTLRHKVWKYSPDVVLLAFFTGNDVRDNSRALNRLPQSPYFVHKGGDLVLDDSFRNFIKDSRLRNVAAALSMRSRLIQVVYGAYQKRKRSAEARQIGTEAGLDDNVYAPPKDRVWKEAWHVTEELIHQMNQEIRGHGAQFWIATLSRGVQVNPDMSKREAFRMRIGVETLFYPDLRIKAFAVREQISTITLAIPFADHAEKHKVFLHGFQETLGEGHWNENGHQLAGEMIAEQMCGHMKAR